MNLFSLLFHSIPHPSQVIFRLLLATLLPLLSGFTQLLAVDTPPPNENLPPEMVETIPPLLFARGGDSISLDLADHIRDPDVPGTAVRLQVRLGTEYRNIALALFDAETPETVANFLAYIDAGLYVNNFFHRSVPGFVLQSGGFRFINETTFDSVPTFAPVINEPGISNTRGTVAMAKISEEPNSATSQWFINLGNNSANLDAQNGGFTVFGRVLGDGMEIVDEIAALPIYIAETIHPAWSNLPLKNFDGNLRRSHFVETTADTVPALKFSALSADPELVAVELSDSILELIPSQMRSGETTITVSATDLEGANSEFDIHVVVANQPTAPFTPGNLLIGHAQKVQEFTLAGDLIQTLIVPHPETTDHRIGDVVYDSNGNIHVLNFSAWHTSYISSYAPTDGSWSHAEIPASYHWGNLADGDLSIWGHYVYGKEFKMNLATREVSAFSIDLFGGVSKSTIGADGILYNVTSGSARDRVQRTHPVTFENIGHPLELVNGSDFINTRGIAVDASGELFVASLDGDIHRFDPAGNHLQTLVTELFSFCDIDLSNSGLLAAGTTNGNLLLTDTGFSQPTFLSLGSAPTYLTFVEVREFPVQAPRLQIERTSPDKFDVSVTNWTDAMSRVRVTGWESSTDLKTWISILHSSGSRSISLTAATSREFARIRYEAPFSTKKDP